MLRYMPWSKFSWIFTLLYDLIGIMTLSNSKRNFKFYCISGWMFQWSNWFRAEKAKCSFGWCRSSKNLWGNLSKSIQMRFARVYFHLCNPMNLRSLLFLSHLGKHVHNCQGCWGRGWFWRKSIRSQLEEQRKVI